ncbi:MAG: VanW family protein [Clostridia bacterium]|nr:VanW family protein [Clostridia bacterium]
MNMRRLLCGLLCLALLLGTAGGEGMEEAAQAALQDGEVTEEQLEEILALDAVDEQEYQATGKVWEEKTTADFNVNSPALYRAKLSSKYSIFAEKSTESRRLYKPNSDVTIDILYVGLKWLITRHDNVIGYSKRQWIAKSTIETLDPVNTPPLNVQKHAWLATTAKACHVRKTMDFTQKEEDDGNNWVILKPGTRISIWQFYEGWAMVNYMRSYGYIDPNELTDLTPVSPTDEEIYDDCPIAAYTSYYKMAQTEYNKNRIHNIKMGCSYVSRVLQPGEMFNANAVMGPYNARKGYRQAPVLVEGTSVPGYGGGTCQVSSTLYNVLIQLPQIEINYRRPHGGEGASYLPIHCDAAVGNDSLNLKFTNHYDFPIRIEGMSNDDGALLMTIYRAD